jgi:hypothetical protein
MMVESRRLVAQSLTLDPTADGVHARRTKYLQEEQAQPVSDLRQRQGRGQLLTPVVVMKWTRPCAD